MNDIKLELKKRAIHFYDEKAQELKTKLLQSLKGVCVCVCVRLQQAQVFVYEKLDTCHL